MSSTVDQQQKSIGNYDLIRVIGKGGMGSVYVGKAQATGETVAIKVLPPELSRNSVVLKRFQQEFRIASRLNHPNIVRALDFGNDGDKYYLVMEYVEGDTLGSRIERRGDVKEEEAVHVIIQAAEGLQAAHSKGLIHRDIKPDNILINKDGTAKVVDLGLAKAVAEDMNLTRTGRGLGTPHFMSPEQFRNAKRVDSRSDVYALGASLYMAVTGELPFRSMSPVDAFVRKSRNDLPPARELQPSLSEQTDRAIRRAMEPDIQKRTQTCAEFIADLQGRSVQPPNSSSANNDVWYFYFKNESGHTQTARGRTEAVRRSVEQSKVGDPNKLKVARDKNGPFLSLAEFPEFRDLVAPLSETFDTSIVGLSDHVPSPDDSFRSLGDHSQLSLNSKPGTKLPHIDVSSSKKSDGGSEILTWIMVLLVAAASAAVSYYFLTQ